MTDVRPPVLYCIAYTVLYCVYGVCTRCSESDISGFEEYGFEEYKPSAKYICRKVFKLLCVYLA